MRAITFHPGSSSGEVCVDTVPDAVVREPDDVVVAVTHAAVCGTDVHLLTHPEGLRPGTVLGHEFVGTVVATADRVAGHAVGDRVVAADYTACGRCWWCRQGRHWHCPQRRFFGTGTTFGPELPGGQAELVRVPFADTCLRGLPDAVDSADALLLGDTLATGYAAVEALQARPGDVVAVVGGGPVGQLSALCAQLVGAAQVVLVEPVEARRTLAAGLGCIAVAPDDAGQLLADLTEGRGADGVVDAVGAPVGLQAGLDLVRAAGRVVSVGVPGRPTFDLAVADAFAREVTIGFAVGDFMRDGDRLMSILASGLVPTGDLLDTGHRLEDATSAYAAMKERRAGKVVMTT